MDIIKPRNPYIKPNIKVCAGIRMQDGYCASSSFESTLEDWGINDID